MRKSVDADDKMIVEIAHLASIRVRVCKSRGGNGASYNRFGC